MNEREIGTGGATLGDCIIGDDGGEMDAILDISLKARKLHVMTERMLAALTPREREVLELRFGPDRPAAVREAERKALLKLRRMP